MNFTLTTLKHLEAAGNDRTKYFIAIDKLVQKKTLQINRKHLWAVNLLLLVYNEVVATVTL